LKRPLEQLLSDPRPPFLDAIDTNPEEARFDFLDFIDAYLEIRPLPALRGVVGAAREGALEEIRLFFLKDDFHELRAFRETSGEFAPWFRGRAEHIARERQRRLNAESAPPEICRDLGQAPVPTPIQWRQTHESTITANGGFRLCVWTAAVASLPASRDGLERLLTLDVPDDAARSETLQRFFDRSGLESIDARRAAAWLFGAEILPSADGAFSLHRVLQTPGAELVSGSIENESALVVLTETLISVILAVESEEPLRKRVRRRIDEWLADRPGAGSTTGPPRLDRTE
jgi:hypothetical protein